MPDDCEKVLNDIVHELATSEQSSSATDLLQQLTSCSFLQKEELLDTISCEIESLLSYEPNRVYSDDGDTYNIVDDDDNFVPEKMSSMYHACRGNIFECVHEHHQFFDDSAFTFSHDIFDKHFFETDFGQQLPKTFREFGEALIRHAIAKQQLVRAVFDQVIDNFANSNAEWFNRSLVDNIHQPSLIPLTNQGIENLSRIDEIV